MITQKMVTKYFKLDKKMTSAIRTKNTEAINNLSNELKPLAEALKLGGFIVDGEEDSHGRYDGFYDFGVIVDRKEYA